MARTQKEVTKIKLGNYLRKTIEVYENQSENDFCRGASAALGMVLFMLTTKEYDIEVTETAEMKLERDRAAIKAVIEGMTQCVASTRNSSETEHWDRKPIDQSESD